MNGHTRQVRLQAEIAGLLNSNVRMALPIADSVTAELDWHISNIANTVSLLFKKKVLSRSG